MTPDRSLRPADAAVAFRSFPRRFRSAIERPGDDDEGVDPDEIARRVGPGGTSAVDHLVAADGVTALLDGALEVVVRGHVADAALHPFFADLAAASWEDPRTPVPDLVGQFEATATRAADRVEAVPAERWSTAILLAGTERTLGLLEAVQDVVGAVSDHLRAAQAVIDAVRR